MSILRLVLLVLLITLPLPVLGSSPSRPYTGRGTLIIPSSALSTDAGLYEYPGVRLIRTVLVADLPSLAASIPLKGGGIALATVALREGYARVTVAASGEAEWLALRENWQILSWERFLKGKSIRLEAGLRDASYQLKQIPAEAGNGVGLTSADAVLVVEDIKEDWALIRDGKATSGWLRWRDGDGRLMVMVE